MGIIEPWSLSLVGLPKIKDATYISSIAVSSLSLTAPLQVHCSMRPSAQEEQVSGSTVDVVDRTMGHLVSKATVRSTRVHHFQLVLETCAGFAVVDASKSGMKRMAQHLTHFPFNGCFRGAGCFGFWLDLGLVCSLYIEATWAHERAGPLKGLHITVDASSNWLAAGSSNCHWSLLHYHSDMCQARCSKTVLKSASAQQNRVKPECPEE